MYDYVILMVKVEGSTSLITSVYVRFVQWSNKYAFSDQKKKKFCALSPKYSLWAIMCMHNNKYAL